MKFSKDQNVLVFEVSELHEWKEPRKGVYKSEDKDGIYCFVWFPDNNSSQPIMKYIVFPDTPAVWNHVNNIKMQHTHVRQAQKELLSMYMQARNAVARGEV